MAVLGVMEAECLFHGRDVPVCIEVAFAQVGVELLSLLDAGRHRQYCGIDVGEL